MDEEIERLGKDIASGERSVRQSADTLREELYAMESRLLTELRSLVRESVGPFIEENIGLSGDSVGFKLRSRIDRAIQRCADQSVKVLEGVEAKISHTLDNTSEIIDTLAASAFGGSAQALGALGKIPPAAIKAGIFAARDVLKSTIGLAIKFRPWEAAKYAGNIATYAGPVGIGLQMLGDAVGVIRSHNAEKELASVKVELSDMIKLHFQTVYAFLDTPEKSTQAVAPGLVQFRESMAQQVSQLGEVQQRHRALQAGRDAVAGLSVVKSPVR